MAGLGHRRRAVVGQQAGDSRSQLRIFVYLFEWRAKLPTPRRKNNFPKSRFNRSQFRVKSECNQSLAPRLNSDQSSIRVFLSFTI